MEELEQRPTKALVNVTTDFGKHQENDRDKYQILYLMSQDCWSFINNFHSLLNWHYNYVHEQIAIMRKLWNEVSIKPEWLTLANIDEMESRMKEILNKEEKQ